MSLNDHRNASGDGPILVVKSKETLLSTWGERPVSLKRPVVVVVRSEAAGQLSADIGPSAI
jgi:hypothetical protein